MSTFSLYLELGLDHILDPNGYDHVLFVLVLCAVYSLADWKRILILVTAFTIGHSITLALATLKLVEVRSDVIEFLIPLTILLTAILNLFKKDRYSVHTRKISANYLLALFFGLIHGLGFSNYLRALLGKEENIISQLFAFNIGLEVGQIIIVVIFLIVTLLCVDLFGVKKRDWRLIVSSACGGIALMLLMENKFW